MLTIQTVYVQTVTRGSRFKSVCQVKVLLTKDYKVTESYCLSLKGWSWVGELTGENLLIPLDFEIPSQLLSKTAKSKVTSNPRVQSRVVSDLEVIRKQSWRERVGREEMFTLEGLSLNYWPHQLSPCLIYCMLGKWSWEMIHDDT